MALSGTWQIASAGEPLPDQPPPAFAENHDGDRAAGQILLLADVDRHPVFQILETTATGVRVPSKTQAPLTFSGMLSTIGHRDQSSAAIDRYTFQQPAWKRTGGQGVAGSNPVIPTTIPNNPQNTA